MTQTPNLDALLTAVAAHPPRWRMLRRTPSLLSFCDCTPDECGGEWLALTPANLRALVRDIGRIVGGVTDSDGNGFAWLRKDGSNAFDAPNMESAANLANHLFICVNNGLFFSPLFAQLANAYMLATWIARQAGIIGPEAWGACFMAGWVRQPCSLHSAIDLSPADTAAMLMAMGDTGGFYWNSAIKSRADLPETIRLYRGIAANNVQAGFLGYSWTDERATAKAYAIHRNQQGKGAAQVVSAIFRREDIATVIEHQCAGGYREWLILPGAKPLSVEIQAFRFNPLLFDYDAVPAQ